MDASSDELLELLSTMAGAAHTEIADATPWRSHTESANKVDGQVVLVEVVVVM